MAVYERDFGKFLDYQSKENPVDANYKLPQSYTYENMIRALAKENNISIREASKMKPSDYVLAMCLSAVENTQQSISMKKSK